jgi:hypothetical protein
MNQRSLVAALILTLVVLLRASPAAAEPYLAVLEGYKCNVCHVNPTGGGLRNDFGLTYAKVLLPAETVDNTLDSWSGKLTDRLRIGGDLRADWSRETEPNTPSQQAFALEQFRVYADLTILPDRLGIYVDEQVAPNGSQNEEAYVRYGSTTDGFYLKGGQFYLPFGWRLQDQTAFVREVTGINMTTPDKGVELGYEHSAWSAQFDLTNGAANASTGSGYQVVTQVVYTKPIWRVGIAGSSTSSSAGDRRMGGLFAGLKTGPIAWLAEGDIVHDDSLQQSTNSLQPCVRIHAAAVLAGARRLSTLFWYSAEQRAESAAHVFRAARLFLAHPHPTSTAQQQRLTSGRSPPEAAIQPGPSPVRRSDSSPSYCCTAKLEALQSKAKRE